MLIQSIKGFLRMSLSAFILLSAKKKAKRVLIKVNRLSLYQWIIVKKEKDGTISISYHTFV